MDLEKAYHRVDRKAIWQVLQMYAGDGMHGKAVKSLYEKSKSSEGVQRGGEELRWDSGIEAEVCHIAKAI